MATCPPTTSDRGRFDPRTPLNRLSDSSRDLPDSLLQVKYGIFDGSVRGLLLNRLPLITDRVYQSLVENQRYLIHQKTSFTKIYRFF